MYSLANTRKYIPFKSEPAPLSGPYGTYRLFNRSLRSGDGRSAAATPRVLACALLSVTRKGARKSERMHTHTHAHTCRPPRYYTHHVLFTIHNMANIAEMMSFSAGLQNNASPRTATIHHSAVPTLFVHVANHSWKYRPDQPIPISIQTGTTQSLKRLRFIILVNALKRLRLRKKQHNLRSKFQCLAGVAERGLEHQIL